MISFPIAIESANGPPPVKVSIVGQFSTTSRVDSGSGRKFPHFLSPVSVSAGYRLPMQT